MDEEQKGLLGKKPQKSNAMWDWLSKKSSAEASEPKKELNLDKDKLEEVSKSFKGAF